MVRRQTKQNKHNTTQRTKKRNNMNPTKKLRKNVLQCTSIRKGNQRGNQKRSIEEE